MLFLLIEDILQDIWPAYYHELKRLHAIGAITDSDECSDVAVYVKNHNPSWRDIARAAYCYGEEAVIKQLFECKIFFKDIEHLIMKYMTLYTYIK